VGRTSSKPLPIAIEEAERIQRSLSNTGSLSHNMILPLVVPSTDGQKGKKKREFPVPEEGDEEERKRRKKKTSTSLGDAIATMAEKKYEFLEKQLVQQSEIRKEELELERKKMEIREKELELEKNRWNVMMERMLGLRDREENR